MSPRAAGRTFLGLLGATFKELGADRDPRMAPALAFYGFFSLAPLFALAVALVGTVVDPVSVEQEIRPQLDQVLPPDAAQWVVDLFDGAIRTSGTVFSLGVALAIITGSGIFLAVQQVLNDIFDVPRHVVRGLFSEIRRRLVAFASAILIGAVMLAVFAAGVGVSYLDALLGTRFPSHRGWLVPLVGYVSPALSLVITWVVFVAILGLMPQTRIPWRAVRRGALFTAGVFIGAALLIGWAFRWIPRFGTLGAVGAVAVVLIVAYLLGEVFVFGAEFTKVYADYVRHGNIAPPHWRDQETGEIVPVPVRPRRRPPPALVPQRGEDR